MATFKFVFGEHQARVGGSPDDMSLRFTANNVNNLSLQDMWALFTSGANGRVGRYVNNGLKSNLQSSCNDWGNCDYVSTGLRYPDLKAVLYISGQNQTDVEWWNNNIAGHSLSVIFSRCDLVLNNGSFQKTINNWYVFSVTNLPIIDLNAQYILSETCIDWSAFGDLDNDHRSLCGILSVGNSLTSFDGHLNDYTYVFSGNQSNCEDLRTSTSTQECLITINGLDAGGNSQSEQYTLMFQPDSNHTSGQVTNLGIMDFRSISGVTCRFTGGVVRGSGIIKINGRIHGSKIGAGDLLGNTLIPSFDTFVEDCILLQASFEPCCDTPVSWSETYTDVLDSVKDDTETMTGILEITSIEWSGFELLTDYCCDESDCSDVSISYPPNSTIIGGGESGGGESGGGESGGSGFDECVCEWLESIDGRLDSINTNLSGIKTAIEHLDCICDWLETINDTLSDLELSPTINNTVSPCEPTVEIQPVTVSAPAVTVNPPVVNVSAPNVTVQSPTVNNPITVTPCQPTVEIQPVTVSAPAVTVNNSIDGLVCEDSLGNQESLACILKNALNYNSKSISEIVYKKEFGSDFFVEISPNEFLQYKKVVKYGEDDS